MSRPLDLSSSDDEAVVDDDDDGAYDGGAAAISLNLPPQPELASAEALTHL